jgi:hypothetical protein
LLVSRVQLTSNRSHGLSDRSDEVDVLLREGDLALHDPRDVQQIVQQAGHLLGLPPDHREGVGERAPCGRQPAEDAGGVLDRAQRIAEFVRQHRQELIPLADRLDRPTFRLLLLGDVTGHVHAS